MATKYKPLECVECEADLLETGLGSVVLVKERRNPDNVVDAYWACQPCDSALQKTYRSRGCTTDWTRIDSLLNPGYFVHRTMRFMNDMHCGMRFGDQSLRKLESALLLLSEQVLRRQTKKEKKRLASLLHLDEVRLASL